MPLSIKHLKCRVTVRTSGKKETPLHKDTRSPRPSMLYALPQGMPAGETAPVPGDTAVEPSLNHESAQPRRVDPQQVADRVYDLMRDEIRITKMRSG